MPSEINERMPLQIDTNEGIELSARESIQILNVLESPPEPNKKLLAAALGLLKNQASINNRQVQSSTMQVSSFSIHSIKKSCT